MAFKIPRKVPRYKLNIKGSPWTIYLVNQEQFDKIHKELAGSRLMGLSDGNTHSIFILTEYPLAVALNTLFHEICHSWLDSLDSSKIPNADDTDMLVAEELVCDSVGPGMVELFSHLNILLDFMNKHFKEVGDDDE
jgi:hypothetical protein